MRQLYPILGVIDTGRSLRRHNPSGADRAGLSQDIMRKLIVAAAALAALVGVAASAGADDHVLTGAAIGAGSGAVIAGPPGAVVGGVIGAVVGGPEVRFHNHHRVHMDGRRHYYLENHERHYY